MPRLASAVVVSRFIVDVAPIPDIATKAIAGAMMIHAGSNHVMSVIVISISSV